MTMVQAATGAHQPGQSGPEQGFTEGGPPLRPPLLLYMGEAGAVEVYLDAVQEGLEDPGAQRALRIMHGAGTQTTGLDLYRAIRGDIRHQIGSGVWPEIARIVSKNYLARLATWRETRGQEAL